MTKRNGVANGSKKSAGAIESAHGGIVIEELIVHFCFVKKLMGDERRELVLAKSALYHPGVANPDRPIYRELRAGGNRLAIINDSVVNHFKGDIFVADGRKEIARRRSDETIAIGFLILGKRGCRSAHPQSFDGAVLLKIAERFPGGCGTDVFNTFLQKIVSNFSQLFQQKIASAKTLCRSGT